MKMQRRRFFKTLGGAAGALAAGRALGMAEKPAAALEPDNFTQIPGVLPGDLEAYFTEEKLRETIDTAVSLKGIEFQVVCYNFPSWHPTPYMEKIFGKGWTEFETLKNSKPLYAGHLFPKYPLWGYFNEAEPEWAEKEIETASTYGIDVWMIDWYWHNGTMFYHEQLENGFLKARNREKLKFAVMWANHDWSNLYPAVSTGTPALLLPQLHSEDDCLKVIDYCIEHYFHEPNYWRIDGRLVFSFFSPNHLRKFFTPDQLRRVVDKMRERTARAGLGELHIQASGEYEGLEGELKHLGFDSATLYHTWGWMKGLREGTRVPYGVGAVGTIQYWKETAAKGALAFYPDCPVGWDSSARFGPHTVMVFERTPDQYERVMRAAQYFSAASPAEPKIIFLSNWNEWTEDHVLLPDTIFGYSYLEAVRRLFRANGLKAC
jgi:hypothetical protein